jgi:hypothetical protein
MERREIRVLRSEARHCASLYAGYLNTRIASVSLATAVTTHIAANT